MFELLQLVFIFYSLAFIDIALGKPVSSATLLSPVHPQGNQIETIGICQGLEGDSTIRIMVGSDNSRTLIDTTRPSFVQSLVHCAGKAPKPQRGRCDDEAIRVAWNCQKLDFSKDDTPELKAMVDPILERCNTKPSQPPSVLMLGLGGGIKPSYLKMKCPGISVTTVEKNPNVVTVAKDFFAFSGDVIVQDMHKALKDLARKGRRFDVVVSDIGHRVVLDKEDMRSASALLNSNGLVLEKLSEPKLEPNQMMMFKTFLSGVTEKQLPRKAGRRGSIILFGSKKDAGAVTPQ